MSNRKSDTQPRNHFRSGRFFNAEGQWHFTTREQTIEGPFASKQKASDGLARYVKAINCIMLEASGRESVGQLSMEHRNNDATSINSSAPARALKAQ